MYTATANNATMITSALDTPTNDVSKVIIQGKSNSAFNFCHSSNVLHVLGLCYKHLVCFSDHDYADNGRNTITKRLLYNVCLVLYVVIKPCNIVCNC